MFTYQYSVIQISNLQIWKFENLGSAVQANIQKSRLSISLLICEKFGSAAYWVTFKNPNFHLCHELGKIMKSSLEQHLNITIFNLLKNCEKFVSTL